MTERITDREREILVEVVRLHLATGEPVASAAVARSSATGLSSASIRTVMAELEAKGLLTQPHTSAGRVPTDAGFRHFLDLTAGLRVLAPRDELRLREMLAPSGALEELLPRVSGVLARMTAQVGVALAPAARRAALQSIHFVRVAGDRVLAVVVTQGGKVESRLLEVEHDFGLDELERISNYCTRSFAGMSLVEIRDRLVDLMAEDRARCDTLMAGVLELARRATEGGAAGGAVFVNGTERLIERIGPSELETVRHLFAAFADKARLVALLNDYLAMPGPRVVLGSEVSIEGGADLGLIVTSFELATGESGLIGVIGLKRMNYPQIIPIVDFVGHYVAEACQ